MLVLSRKCQEAVVVGGSDGFERMLKVTVLEIRGGQVRLGFEAEAKVPVHRLEVWERIQRLEDLERIHEEAPSGSPTAGPVAVVSR